jgi:hypothetical protein
MISKEFLEEERLSMPGSRSTQEYICEFIDSEDAVSTYERIQASISNEIEPLEF